MTVGDLMEASAAWMSDEELTGFALTFATVYIKMLETVGVKTSEVDKEEALRLLAGKDVIELKPGMFSIMLDPNTDPIVQKHRLAAAN
jgi:hypothetical protein